MTNERANAAAKLGYIDPHRLLTVKGALEETFEEWVRGLPKKPSRNKAQQLLDEMIEAAGFSCGMAEIWKRPVAFSPTEGDTHDCILAVGASDDTQQPGFLALQLKTFTEYSGDLQSFLDGIVGQYSDPDELFLAVAVNRPGEVDFGTIRAPEELKAEILELWVFGRDSEDPARWFFYGDMLDAPKLSYHRIEDVIPFSGRGPIPAPPA